MLSKIKEPQQLLLTLNHDFCAKRYLEHNTELKALRAGVVKLSEINQAYAPGTAEDLISAWLLSLSMYVRIEVDKKLIQEISIELYKEMVRYYGILENLGTAQSDFLMIHMIRPYFMVVMM